MKLKALPIQIIRLKDGILLKRGCTEIKVPDDGSIGMVARVLTIAGQNGVTREEISNLFSLDEHHAAQNLIDLLLAGRLLVPSELTDPLHKISETPLDIFYWHFGVSADQATTQLNSRKLVIIGVNSISRRLVASLTDLEVENFQVVDDPCMRNPDLFDDEGNLLREKWSSNHSEPVKLNVWEKQVDPASVHCIIACSDLGTHQGIRDCNKFCVKNRCHFLPVILQDLTGYVGPLMVPGETACYECLRQRQNAHMKDPEVQRASEIITSTGRKVVGFHPSMTSVLGDIAAFELTRLYSDVLPFRNIGTQIEVNLLTSEMMKRKVLKVPRCAVCSPLTTRSSATPYKSNFVPRGGGIT
jgi:bacteriocin biosynthesis cyclodehydratase domain-containing protein